MFLMLLSTAVHGSVFGPNTGCRFVRGETPLLHSVRSMILCEWRR